MKNRRKIIEKINEGWEDRRESVKKRKLKMNQQSLDWHKREKEGKNLVRRVVYPSQERLPQKPSK